MRRKSRALFWAVGLFSIFGNLLMLTGPFYMLLVYDRVMTSRSVETLIALTLLAGFLFVIMGVLDFARARTLARIGAQFQADLDPRVYDAALRRAAQSSDPAAATALSDLEAIQRMLASPVLPACFDLPWTPLFLAGIALFHPLLGIMAVVGGGLLILVALLNRHLSHAPQAATLEATLAAQTQSDQMRAEAGMVRAMGMGPAAHRRWEKLRRNALSGQMASSDVTSGFTALSRTLRLFLQSAMLGLGAWLAMTGQVTAGAMIAGSILLGRALAPIEQLIASWALMQRARRGWVSLSALLTQIPPEPPRTALPRPEAQMDVVQITVVPPGRTHASLRMLSFAVAPGQALGVIGPSGAGKTTLARTLTGAWPCAGGKVRLGGAGLDHYDPEELGRMIGYLPQRVELFDGTIAENIARMAEKPDSAMVVEAAKKADAHEMILKMPEGYDTRVSGNGASLSGGQIQRIGLARAMYGDPVILVLDEPNSNLDNEGSEALNMAIRTMKGKGRSVLIMAHRPGAIRECDLLLVLEGGNRAAFGPRDDVLKQMVKNHDQILRSTGTGGIR